RDADAAGGELGCRFGRLHRKVDETVLDRTSDSETGSFTTDITGLKLSGPLSLPSNPSLDGLTIVATLDTMHTSSGTTRITADGSVFKIDSFFDVFIDVS